MQRVLFAYLDLVVVYHSAAKVNVLSPSFFQHAVTTLNIITLIFILYSYIIITVYGTFSFYCCCRCLIDMVGAERKER